MSHWAESLALSCYHLLACCLVHLSVTVKKRFQCKALHYFCTRRPDKLLKVKVASWWVFQFLLSCLESMVRHNGRYKRDVQILQGTGHETRQTILQQDIFKYWYPAAVQTCQCIRTNSWRVQRVTWMVFEKRTSPILLEFICVECVLSGQAQDSKHSGWQQLILCTLSVLSFGLFRTTKIKTKVLQ